MVLGDLDSYMQKKWNFITNLHHTQNKFKVDKRLKYKSWHHKSPSGKHWQENLRHSMQQKERRSLYPLQQQRDGTGEHYAKWKGYICSILCSCPLCQILTDHRDLGLFLSSLFSSIDLCVYSYACTRLFWLPRSSFNLSWDTWILSYVFMVEGPTRKVW